MLPHSYTYLARLYQVRVDFHLDRVYNILSHTVEADRILYEDPSPSSGFLIIPDLKWDRKTLSSLYLVAITHNGAIKCLRDLRKEHLGMLKSIRREAAEVVRKYWGIDGQKGLRFFIHYQPTYCASLFPPSLFVVVT